MPRTCRRDAAKRPAPRARAGSSTPSSARETAADTWRRSSSSRSPITRAGYRKRTWSGPETRSGAEGRGAPNPRRPRTDRRSCGGWRSRCSSDRARIRAGARSRARDAGAWCRVDPAAADRALAEVHGAAEQAGFERVPHDGDQACAPASSGAFVRPPPDPVATPGVALGRARWRAPPRFPRRSTQSSIRSKTMSM